MPEFLDVSCVVCGSPDVVDLAELADVPVVCNQLLRSPAAARQVVLADIRLAGCRCCGHVFNAAFDPARVVYDAQYENSLMGSPHYRRFTETIIDRLFSTYGLGGGTAVEIGCGRGEFLRMLCDRGLRRGIGFDPSRPDGEIAADGATIRIVGDIFRPSLAPNADIVCSRYVLEHLPRPVDLFRSIRDAYASSPARVVFIEVPNGAFMLEEPGVWDPLYEHVSYFTPSSLSRALTLAGLAPGPIRIMFGRQFLGVEATFPGGDADHPPSPPPDIQSFDSFGHRFTSTIQAWRKWLGIARWEGRRIALWGAGAKGVTFLNVLDRSLERAIDQVVDINPRKAGAFAAGTGHPIVPPSALRERRPDIVLVMNPEYEAEIRQTLDELGLSVEVAVISGRLPPRRTHAPGRLSAKRPSLRRGPWRAALPDIGRRARSPAPRPTGGDG